MDKVTIQLRKALKPCTVQKAPPPGYEPGKEALLQNLYVVLGKIKRGHETNSGFNSQLKFHASHVRFLFQKPSRPYVLQ